MHCVKYLLKFVPAIHGIVNSGWTDSFRSHHQTSCLQNPVTAHLKLPLFFIMSGVSMKYKEHICDWEESWLYIVLIWLEGFPMHGYHITGRYQVGWRVGEGSETYWMSCALCLEYRILKVYCMETGLMVHFVLCQPSWHTGLVPFFQNLRWRGTFGRSRE